MTTKYKIIIGFSLMVCMLTVGGALGYIKLYEASEGFAVYQIYSKTAVDANGADALMRGAQDQLSRFRLNTNQEHVKQALAFAERAINYYLAEAKLAENNPQELMMLDGQIERIKQFMRLAEDMQQKLTAGTRMVDEQLASSSRETNTALRGMAEIARGIGNYTILEIIDTATNYYANARVWVRHYSDIFLESSAANAEQDLAAFGAALKKLESLILSGENKQTLSKLLQRYEEYVNNFKTVKTLLEEGLLAQRRIDALSAELIKEFDAYKARAEKNMSAIGQATQASNIQGQRIILAGSVFGFFIGMLAAFLIIMGITKVLKNASSLAVTIANGDFQARIGPHEGGEIGEMLDSLQKISTILQSVLNDYNNLETRIVAGELDAKPDPSAYKGDFARLITDTDAILERFLQVLENIPSPVLVMGKDLKVTYVNAITRRLCGGDYKGKTDPQLSRREDDGSPTDAVKKAAATL
ncbi:MAG: hypothetical protein FWF99_07125, partial [Desulfovibrionaceae bacterium]|nr:hypothetical protein [Desulfovibrionaceae bacterium]